MEMGWPVSPEEAVTSAVANARLAGMGPDAEWIDLLGQYARGELTLDELIELALEDAE